MGLLTQDLISSAMSMMELPIDNDGTPLTFPHAIGAGGVRRMFARATVPGDEHWEVQLVSIVFAVDNTGISMHRPRFIIRRDQGFFGNFTLPPADLVINFPLNMEVSPEVPLIGAGLHSYPPFELPPGSEVWIVARLASTGAFNVIEEDPFVGVRTAARIMGRAYRVVPSRESAMVTRVMTTL